MAEEQNNSDHFSRVYDIDKDLTKNTSTPAVFNQDPDLKLYEKNINSQDDDDDDDAASMDSVLCVSGSRLLKKGFTQNDCTIQEIKTNHIGIFGDGVKFGFTVDEGGRRMSVAQYFQDKYDVKNLQVGSDSKPAYIPMEICYFFYKNVTFGVTVFLFEAYTSFSGQAAYNDWYLSFYNVLFTALPTLALGVLDQDVSTRFCIKVSFHFPSCKLYCFPNKKSKNHYYKIVAKSSNSEENGHLTTAPVLETENQQSTSFLSLLCPLLKVFAASDPSQERNTYLEVATSSLSSLARFPWGSRSIYGNSPDPEIAAEDPPVHLQLFEFEACPFCRRVREALTELDLSVQVYPCPKGSVRHREVVRQLGGKEQYPFLVDPGSGVSMYESGDIVKYLFEQYGGSRSPSVGLLESYSAFDGSSTLFTGWMPTVLRAGRGMTFWEKARKDSPPKMLELFSYENNPYARIVREALCELEIPYILHNVGKGSIRYKLLLQTSGSIEVPYLIDPNTDSQIGNYEKILSYLFMTYATTA
ncbi:hypothetical protein IFM89_022612 [Coptis chinensis]|uniref:GST N-terminal domain-containing protein n=1 Tax=Coptis chinensis TaxID=261450 RepID=A0A835IC53_9MAGN|nr:hypothetical protein IFM89_022612 [Coptis chinensis]